LSQDSLLKTTSSLQTSELALETEGVLSEFSLSAIHFHDFLVELHSKKNVAHKKKFKPTSPSKSADATERVKIIFSLLISILVVSAGSTSQIMKI